MRRPIPSVASPRFASLGPSFAVPGELPQPPLCSALCVQYEAHPTWSYQLHADNLEVICEDDSAIRVCPSYTTLRRYMKDALLLRRPRVPNANRPGAVRARERLEASEASEVRRYEATHVHGLWHSDFHFGSRHVVTRTGALVVPKLLGVLDDLSLVGCHAQWSLDEETESFVHGLNQAFQKRDLPSALMNGSADPPSRGTRIRGDRASALLRRAGPARRPARRSEARGSSPARCR